MIACRRWWSSEPTRRDRAIDRSASRHGAEKLPFNAAHDVGEVVITDPGTARFVWLRLDGDSYRAVDHGDLLGVDVAGIVTQIDWPPVGED